MMTKYEILNILKQYQNELEDRYSIVSIGLFGSYAEERATEESDIDLYVKFRDKKFKNIAGSWNFLEEKLGKKVDFIYEHSNMRNGLKEHLENKTVYENILSNKK